MEKTMDKAVSKYYMDKLKAVVSASEYDGILIAPSEELNFFTGFSPMMCERFQGLFVTKKGEAFYFCNLLYADQMREAYGEEIPVYTWFDGDSMVEKFKPVAEKYGLIGGKILVNQSVQAFQVLDISEGGNSFSTAERHCWRKCVSAKHRKKWKICVLQRILRIRLLQKLLNLSSPV